MPAPAAAVAAAAVALAAVALAAPSPGVVGAPAPAAAPAAAAPATRPAPAAAAGRPARAADAPRPGAAWRWPLDPAPAVLRGFDVGPFPWSPGHRGVDLGPRGDPVVVAAGPGVVRFAGSVAGRGVVSVDHGSGLRTTYEPVTASVVAGRRVAAGDVLGRLAGPGSHCEGGPCLHWGALLGDRYLDPLALLRRRDPPVLLPPVGG